MSESKRRPRVVDALPTQPEADADGDALDEPEEASAAEAASEEPDAAVPEDEEELEEAADAELEDATDAEVEAAAEAVEADLALATDEVGEVAGERDEYLDQLRRVQADFENYRKRVMKQQAETVERATEGLVAELLPVLDACDAALAHGDASIEPIAKALIDVLEKQGLDKLAPDGEAFDPNRHEAVAHEPDDDSAGLTVTEVLRPGYVWKGRVLRPAMVRVRG
jgi:molecular chaperone GrpE